MWVIFRKSRKKCSFRLSYSLIRSLSHTFTLYTYCKVKESTQYNALLKGKQNICLHLSQMQGFKLKTKLFKTFSFSRFTWTTGKEGLLCFWIRKYFQNFRSCISTAFYYAFFPINTKLSFYGRIFIPRSSFQTLPNKYVIRFTSKNIIFSILYQDILRRKSTSHWFMADISPSLENI